MENGDHQTFFKEPTGLSGSFPHGDSQSSGSKSIRLPWNGKNVGKYKRQHMCRYSPSFFKTYVNV